MTTATEPPLIVPAVDVADMPALDQPDERACDLPVRHGGGWVECGRRAAWIAVVACACGERISHLICDSCRALILMYPHGDCLTCGGYRCSQVTRVEAL